MRSVLTEKDVAKSRAKRGLKPEEVAKEVLKPDDYISQLAKFIPAEIISFYVAIFAAATSVKAEIPYLTISWVMFALGLVATLIFMLATNRKELTPDKYPGAVTKTVISAVAFVAWAFSLGDPFKSALSWYHPFYGTLFLTFYTLIAPKLYELIQT